jgi:hypothetical protein
MMVWICREVLVPVNGSEYSKKSYELICFIIRVSENNFISISSLDQYRV